MNKKNFKEWLEFLQQESWQLELIISSILLLIIGSNDEYVLELVNKYKATSFGWFIGLLKPILLFIKTNLLVHIFFRGLWIGCIGLRYVSDDIDFDKLAYTERFNRFLKKRITSFDDYIEKLERISSIIFSYSFLMIFHFISFWLFILSGGLIVDLLSAFSNLSKYIGKITILIFYFAGILNFIDFLTLGLLKKHKWIAFVFYPFYRIYNLFSFSFLYRPLHYNFIDNILGRKYMLFMIPYIFLLILFREGINFGGYKYMPLKKQNSNWVINNHYDDLRKNERIGKAAINKFLYQDEPLQLFLPYNDGSETEKCLERLCPDFVPYKRSKFELNAIQSFTDGFKEGMIEQKSKEYKDSIVNGISSQADFAIHCISQLYDIRIDSFSFTSKDFIFYQHTNMGEKGILTVIDISSLSNGKHTLILETKTGYKDDEYIIETIEIPFFKNGVILSSKK
jgi:hypothetical protein